MTAADDRLARGTNRWPEHLSLHTEPVDRRRVTPPTAQRLPTRAPQRVPQRTPQQVPSRAPQYGARAPQPRQPQAATRQHRVAAPAGRLGGPQLRRRWLGAVSAVVLAGATLPVQLGAVGLEALEILSPQPHGGSTPVIAAAMAVQALVLLLPMFAAPAIGGFTHRWRARLVVLSANAGLVAAIAVVGWLKVGQA